MSSSEQFRLLSLFYSLFKWKTSKWMRSTHSSITWSALHWFTNLTKWQNASVFGRPQMLKCTVSEIVQIWKINWSRKRMVSLGPFAFTRSSVSVSILDQSNPCLILQNTGLDQQSTWTGSGCFGTKSYFALWFNMLTGLTFCSFRVLLNFEKTGLSDFASKIVYKLFVLLVLGLRWMRLEFYWELQLNAYILCDPCSNIQYAHRSVSKMQCRWCVTIHYCFK